MKRFVTIATAFCLGAFAFAAESAKGFSRSQMIESWGWFVAREQNLAGIDLSDEELAVFLRGAANQLEGRRAPFELTVISPDVEKLAESRRTKLTRALKEKNLAAAQTFFAGLQKKPGVVLLPSGLRCEIVAPGKNPLPKPQQTVTVHYTGRLLDDTEFVQFGPMDLVLVPNRLSAALYEGFQKIGAGGRITLYVPPPLPVEEEIKLGIPTGSAVVYNVELLDVKETSAEDLANALLPPAPEPPPPPPSGFTTMQQIETWGWSTLRTTGAGEFGFKVDERAAFLRGLRAGVAGRPIAEGLEGIWGDVQKFVSAQRQEIRRAALQKRRDAMNALFADLKKNSQVVELPSGLRYQILEKGAGRFPKNGQMVIVDYTGRLLDGTVFDRTDNEPLHIEIGSVNEGLNEGLQKIDVGGRIRLYVPPSIGYGDENTSGVVTSIPAGSALIYEIKLHAIQENASASDAVAK